MFKTFRKKIASLLSVAALVAVPLAMPVAVYAANGDIQGCLAQGTNLDATGVTNGSDCSNTDTSTANTNINNIIKTIVNIFSLIVGIVAVIMIIVGGLKYITSGGESNNISSAKSTIIYAIIGLVVVALAQFIVQFVLNKVTNS
jgi:cytochrome bd-type quinol oxidase subunit 2